MAALGRAVSWDRSVLARGGLLLLLLLAFAVRLVGLTTQSMWRDEIDALRFAEAPLDTLLDNFGRVGWNGPLFYLLLRPWLMVVGRSELALRYFSLWFGVVGVALAYRLGREWFSRRVGGLAALLMALSPYMVWYAQELKMYALLCVLAQGVIYVYHRALREGDWRAWTAVVALSWAAVGVHIMGALLIPLLVLLLGVWWPWSRAQWRQALIALTATLLPGLLVGPWAIPALLRGGNIGHAFVPLPTMVNTMLYAFSQGIVNVGGVWPLGLMVFGLLIGTVFGVRHCTERGVQHDTEYGAEYFSLRHVLAAWAWLVWPPIGLYLVSLRLPMFVDRYLIWIGPACYLLVGRGLEQVRRLSRLAAALFLAALLLFDLGGLWQQQARPIKSDFRQAAALVRQHRRPGELIVFHISYVRYTFEYYYGDSSPHADGVATDDRSTEAAVDADMRRRTAGYETVWLVLSEPEMWDRRGMTLAWLNAHAQEQSRAQFERVTVIQYRLLRPNEALK